MLVSDRLSARAAASMPAMESMVGNTEALLCTPLPRLERNADADLGGLVHHSDRGSQYCSNAYVELLRSVNASISMTEDYKPTDNAVAERVNGIIKQEWLYRMKRPRNLDEARKLISGIIDFYNNKRPHMSNGMMTPAQKRESHMRTA